MLMMAWVCPTLVVLILAAEMLMIDYCKAGGSDAKRFGELRVEAMNRMAELGKRVRAKKASA